MIMPDATSSVQTKYLHQKVKILSMTEAHLDFIVSLERHVQFEPWSKRMFLEELNNKHSLCYTMFYESNIVGYVCSVIICDELHILNLTISPSYRRRGLGYALLKYLLNKALEKGLSSALLEVRETNVAAISLYRKAGFVPVGTRREYYLSPDGKEAAILMTKFLHEKI